MIFAVDPGSEQSAIVVLGAAPASERIPVSAEILKACKIPNAELLAWLLEPESYPDSPGLRADPILVIEKVEAMGMAVGREVFETVFWSGRFAQAWPARFTSARVGRHDVKLTLCGFRRAKDSEIRAAIVDRYGASKAAAVGTRSAPGPLYGLRADLWAALAVGLTYRQMEHERAQHAATVSPADPPARAPERIDVGF